MISHLSNLKAPQNGSKALDKMNGLKFHSEVETKSIKRSCPFSSLISHQLLTSLVVMHQIFLGASNDLFLYYYERLQKTELVLIVFKLQASK